jgi:hypothetical protein
MDENNRDEKAAFQEMLNRVHMVLGKAEPDNLVVRLYWDTLRNYTLEDVREALNRHLADVDVGMFVPKPADIIRNIQGNTSTQSELAWTKTEKAVRGVGPWQSVTFDDPIIHQVINDMGGWVAMCGISEQELPFKHIEFVKRYRGYINRAPALDQISGKLGGIAAGQNQLTGIRYEEPPVLVGNVQRAAALLTHGGRNQPKLLTRITTEALDALMDKTKISAALGGPDAK